MKSLLLKVMLVFACCHLAAGAVAPCAPANGGGARFSLKTVEGVVVDIGSAAGEGGMEVVRVTLALEGEGENRLAVLLAPENVMEEIGFAAERGDRLRVRYFLGEEGTCKAHKVLNASRGTMVRFRTLRQIPLWDNQGAWQGGPGAPQGGRHGGGRGGRR
jgi:hypothetical protein